MDELFELRPELATARGAHRFDGGWPDLSEGGRQARLAFVGRWSAALLALDVASLSPDEAVDREILLGELDEMRFDLTELREEAWNPLHWVYLLGGGLHPLLARDFAPLAVRLTSVAERLEGVPGLIATARDVIGSLPDRPVSRLHAEVAGRRIGGVVVLIDEALTLADGAAPSDPAVAALLPRLRAAADGARAALDGVGQHLLTEVAPGARGGPQLGRDLYAARLCHTLRDPAATPEAALARAETEYGLVRAEMARIARELWPSWCPGVAQPSDEGRLVRGVLDAIAADHPAADEMVAFCRAEMERIEAFCREQGVIGLVDEPLEIDWTPEFLRSFGGAMLDSPGALDVGQKAFFSVTPVRAEWDAAEAESYLREQNARQLRLLSIHEGVPGHYLQGVYANRVSSLVRRVFESGLFAEGWAVYVTQVMLDRGYGADDPALWLVHWKFYLRAVVNTILDVRIHCDGMSSDEAIALMLDGAFQERSEAVAKDERARLSSTQLSTYFIGSLGMWDLEHEARVQAAKAVGTTADAVPRPRVVGGYPATPGFDGRAHLESVISHGAPPIPVLRRILLAET
jgi:Bacterial protein of unknown function (DUF885)